MTGKIDGLFQSPAGDGPEVLSFLFNLLSPLVR